MTRSRNGIPIRLTDERWRHITRRHPETHNSRDRLLEIVSDPDTIQQGDYGELLAARSYAETAVGAKLLVVAYREIAADDGFVLTAYYADRLSSRRRTLWTR